MFKQGISLLCLGLACAHPALAQPDHPRWPPGDYALCYGSWDQEKIGRAHAFDLVVVHPGHDFRQITPDIVTSIQRGKDGLRGTQDDVIVLAYVSIGEDDQPPAGPPGPQGGYPKRFLDQVRYVFEKSGERRYGENGKPFILPGKDGIPDENGVWGSYYVDAGDPEWQSQVLARTQRLHQEFGVDGFFLDTLDTASPWGNYASTQARMAALLQRIRKTHPDRLIVGNRGMFLLDQHAAAFTQSLDGMLYESLYALWDWEENEGFLSPWVRGDYQVYKDPVLPASRKPPGFHLFFVNYLNPQQADYFPMLHAIEDLVGRKGVSHYVSDPLLQGLASPYSSTFPQQGGPPLPELGQLSVSELPEGRFRLDLEWQEPNPRDDLILDVRWGPESSEPVLLPSLPVDPANFVRHGERVRGYVEGVGLEPGTPYHLYARLVGKSRSQRTPYLQVSLTSASNASMAWVRELQAQALEGSVELSWKSNRPGPFRIFQGDRPDRLREIQRADKSPARVKGLVNGLSQYFSVATLDGNLAPALRARAQDCTPPLSPTEVVLQTRGNQVSLQWSPSADAKSYKVYCLRPPEKYRIPLKVEAPQTQVQLGALAKGKYHLWVTAVDAAGNESRRNQKLELEVR